MDNGNAKATGKDREGQFQYEAKAESGAKDNAWK